MDNLTELGDTEYLFAIIHIFWSRFWVFFAFLLMLNIVDYFTGVMKAKYLGILNSTASYKGLCKKVFLWIVVLVSIGVTFMIIQIGRIVDVRVGFMALLGILVLFHAISNEFRSIIENIVVCDKDGIVPTWLTKGLEVTNRLIHKKGENIVSQMSMEDADTEKTESMTSTTITHEVTNTSTTFTQTTNDGTDETPSSDDINQNQE